MQLEDYFDFETHNIEQYGLVQTIRVKGTRIGLEFIIQYYLDGESPERIYHGYRHSVSLEQIYAAITYYLHNKPTVDDYIRKGEVISDHYYQEYLKKPPSEVMKRILQIKAERGGAKT